MENTEKENEVRDLLKKSTVKEHSITTNAGEYGIRDLSVASQTEIYQLLKAEGKRSTEDATPDELFNILARMTVFKKEDDSKTFLTKEEANELPQDVKDQVIDHLVRMHGYIARRTNFERTVSGNITSFKPNGSELIYPQLNDESKIEYIHRLRVLKEKEAAKTLSSTMERISKGFNFSPSLSDRIASMVSGLTPEIPKTAIPNFREIPRPVPKLDFHPPKNYTLIELRELNDNVEGLNENILKLNENVLAMSGSTAESAATIGLMLFEIQAVNQSQTQILSQMQETNKRQSDILDEMRAASVSQGEILKEMRSSGKTQTINTVITIILSGAALYFAIVAKDSQILVPHLEGIKDSIEKTIPVKTEVIEKKKK